MLDILGEGFGPSGRIMQIHRRFIDGINRLNGQHAKAFRKMPVVWGL